MVDIRALRHECQTVEMEIDEAGRHPQWAGEYGYGQQGCLTGWRQHTSLATPQLWQIDLNDADQLRSVVVRDGQTPQTILKQHNYGCHAGGNRKWRQGDPRAWKVTHNTMN